MDKDTRNRIQRATQAARGLLEQDFEDQLAGVFDIRLDGTIAGEPGSHLDAAQRIVRIKLIAAVEHWVSSVVGRQSSADDRRPTTDDYAEAVASYRREAAFTTLNRFVALKMLEARGLVQECISRGEQSSGFKEFCGLAPGLVQLPDRGYRLYIESLFDEIGREVRVLFDRRDPASLLWPARATLFGSQQPGLLEILNDPELAGVWEQDETIGWVYQYFNGDDERRQMRAESQAPRNSRELAVRNQFFTPLYVVQFLTDNSLGRIWYEMREGDTRLQNLDYLVRKGASVVGRRSSAKDSPADDRRLTTDDSPTDDAAPTRTKKDPRDLRILDPACGSGHFLLYAFTLLLTIYQEAWEDPDAPAAEVTGRTLRDDYPDRDAMHRALPGLVLRHNLYGIDIDPRAAQIAALALWLRAQRGYLELGVPRGERPPIQRTNIVVAEPMPGEPELRRELLTTLDPDLARLIEQVFQRMELAGEVGSLLRIEEDIRTAVREVYGEQGPLFRALDEARWQQAEAAVLHALRHYAEQSVNGQAYRRRLFSEDAARGFGFIDLCGLRFDVTLMNPPFGAPCARAGPYLASAYPRSKGDLLAACVERGVQWLHPAGILGAITSRTPLFLTSYRHWRQGVLLGEARPTVLADLGHGVMDAAMVEAAAYCLIKQ
ncbi:Eco57I restriction-modification methylase domain-containing protein [Candidatus Thiodictyon syntrophicum]|uniref:site-specific DNA-methyltransferase (adenine-specific) n=1 Tax=Candidatus Thiodictyon syntrophicum TaxID=1166950 RepID=A0A2K8UAS4_9GAMM|nr:DNA methyltransferase [Candidatus Thiodictyon syntrophicum]AUB82637.1 hypothetical protein THSYN_17935 [Candidatus Thiodictyon syntrophicum]